MDYSSGSDSTSLERRISLVLMILNLQTKTKDYLNNVRRFEVCFFQSSIQLNDKNSPSCSIAMVTLTSGQSIILTQQKHLQSVRARFGGYWLLNWEMEEFRGRESLGTAVVFSACLSFFISFILSVLRCFLFLRPRPLPPCYWCL